MSQCDDEPVRRRRRRRVTLVDEPADMDIQERGSTSDRYLQ